MNKRDKIIYYVSTGLFTLMMLMSAGMYFVKYPDVSAIFTKLGFPTFIIYPLAIAKILGVAAIWTRMSTMLREWAYAGFFFDFLLAMSAHLAVNDGEHVGAIIAMILLFISYFFGKRAFATSA